jgi:hypothetical protein
VNYFDLPEVDQERHDRFIEAYYAKFEAGQF